MSVPRPAMLIADGDGEGWPSFGDDGGFFGFAVGR